MIFFIVYNIWLTLGALALNVPWSASWLTSWRIARIFSSRLRRFFSFRVSRQMRSSELILCFLNLPTFSLDDGHWPAWVGALALGLEKDEDEAADSAAPPTINWRRRTRLWSSSNSSSRTPRRGRSRKWWKRRKTSSSSKTRQVGSHSCCQSCLEELAPELHILVGEPLQKLSFSSSLTSGSSSFTLRSSSTVPCSGGQLRGKNQNDTLIFRSHADLVGDPWIKSWIKN